MRTFLFAAGAALMAFGLAFGTHQVPAHAQPTPAAYPAPATTGFHHLGLVYHHSQRTAEDWNNWVAQHRGTQPVQGRWLFDAYLMLDLQAPSGTYTDTGDTNAADWRALLDRWFGTAPGGGTIGAIDSAIDRVAATTSTAGTPMGQPPARRKIVVSIPWASVKQATFGPVDGRPADLRVPAERDRVTAWYLNLVEQRFAAGGYHNVDLWGVYLMREDITPRDEAWATATSAAAHERGMKIAWVPYFQGAGWERWRQFGIDVAIMQPGYGFRSPVDGGNVDASRLAVTAGLARSAGLGIEIEARGSAASAYESAMFVQYLAEGARLGYRDASTAYFLGQSRRPVTRDDAVAALADYLAGGTPRSVDAGQPAWQWTGTGTLVATAIFGARSDLTAVRADLPAGSTWRGTVVAEQLVGDRWRPGGHTYAGGVTGGRQTVLVPLATTAGVTSLRLTFTPGAGGTAITVERLTLDAVWSTGGASVTTGTPYTFNTQLQAPGSYRDVTDTTSRFGRGLLTDGHWSDSGWWEARPLGWWDTAPVRVVFDLGGTRPVDRIVLHSHEATDVAVNWPWAPVVHLATDAPVLTSSRRGADTAGTVTTLAGSAPAITGGHGPSGREYDGTITFTAGAAVTARYATLVAQPTGWFLADEVRFFAGGADVTGSVSYRTLTVPNAQVGADPSGYPDNANRLTDGNVAPISSGGAVTGTRAGTASTITVDLLAGTTVASATAWYLADESWGVVRPGKLTVETSVDGTTWTALGQTTAVARSWNQSVAMTTTGTARTARFIRYTAAADPTRPMSWHMVSEVEAGRCQSMTRSPASAASRSATASICSVPTRAPRSVSSPRAPSSRDVRRSLSAAAVTSNSTPLRSQSANTAPDRSPPIVASRNVHSLNTTRPFAASTRTDA